MPLRDHFHGPLYSNRHWESFHSAWATCLSSYINARLPKGYFAEPNVKFGIEFDTASFEEREHLDSSPTATAVWAPPAPAVRVPMAVLTDIIQVDIYEMSGGYTLAGAIELVSPANKDRPASRDAFVSKCAAYIQQGIGVVIVDVVTGRTANLHNALMARLNNTEVGRIASDLYAVGYHPVSENEETLVDVWPEPLAVGQPLPTLPMWLRGGLVFPLELEATYERTSVELRISSNGT